MEETSIKSCFEGTDFAREVEFLVKQERKEQSKVKHNVKLNVFRAKILFLAEKRAKVPVDYQRTVNEELVAQLTALNNHQRALAESSDRSLLQENAALTAQLIPKQVKGLISKLKR